MHILLAPAGLAARRQESWSEAHRDVADALNRQLRRPLDCNRLTDRTPASDELVTTRRQIRSWLATVLRL